MCSRNNIANYSKKVNSIMLLKANFSVNGTVAGACILSIDDDGEIPF